MKEVYSYQEIGAQIDQGKQVVFTCFPEARVTALQKSVDSDAITVTIQLSIQGTCVGIIDYEYPSILAVLEAFDIDDGSEIWEVLAE